MAEDHPLPSTDCWTTICGDGDIVLAQNDAIWLRLRGTVSRYTDDVLDESWHNEAEHPIYKILTPGEATQCKRWADASARLDADLTYRWCIEELRARIVSVRMADGDGNVVTARRDTAASN